MEEDKTDNLNEVENQVKKAKYNYPPTSKNNTKCILITIGVILMEALTIIICYFIFRGIDVKKNQEDPLKKDNNNNNCEIGEEDKCLTCSTIKNECSSCNFRYLLIDGKCIPNYSFRAEYKTTYNDENVTLIYYLPYDFYSRYNDSKILEMAVDGKEVTPSRIYNFKSPGIHKVYFTLNITNNDCFYSMFKNNKHLTSIYFSQNFNTENIKFMNGMFYNCESLTSIYLSYFNTSQVQTLNYMFRGCKSLTSINISNFDTSEVVRMEEMFYGCDILTSIEISNFDTSKVKTMNHMFYDCKSLVSVNLNNFNTFNVNNISKMFSNCESLTSIDISNFNIQNITDMSSLFDNCTKLSFIDISSFYNISDINESIFNNVAPKGKIKINENLINFIKDIIPENWEIITN